ncbi:hypothetical protein [Radicibacter daui]|uniref:hypothetical protein n=1 Tax=Radicibacter daui TaxID=3064829 RepID=UPI004046EF0B
MYLDYEGGYYTLLVIRPGIVDFSAYKNCGLGADEYLIDLQQDYGWLLEASQPETTADGDIVVKMAGGITAACPCCHSSAGRFLVTKCVPVAAGGGGDGSKEWEEEAGLYCSGCGAVEFE